MTIMDKSIIAIASDHAAFELKEKLRFFLIKQGYSVLDCGTYSEASVDYPDYISKASRLVSQGKIEKAIVMCGSGVGASLVANKHPKVRAALVWTPKLARLSREHNNANVLVLPGRFVKFSKAKKITKSWLTTSYSDAPRHSRRLDKLRKIEKSFIFFFFFALFFSFLPSGFTKTLTWTGSKLKIFTNSNLGLKENSNGFYLGIKSFQPKMTEDFDLYLNFNKKKIIDETKHYKIKTQNVIRDKNFFSRETPTVGFLFKKNHIDIRGNKKDFLNEQVDMGSFSVSFWLYAVSDKESDILSKGTYNKNTYQGVRIKIHNSKLYVIFSNFFFDIDNKSKTFTLSSPCTTGKWDNYFISFDKRTGKLSLYKNNEEESVVWATETGRPESTVFIPHFQGYSDLKIGNSEFGYLDDFIVFNKSFENSPDSKLIQTKETFLISPVLEADTFDAHIQKFVVNFKEKEKAFFRSENQIFSKDDYLPSWKTSSVTGKYFQFKYPVKEEEKIYKISVFIQERPKLNPPRDFSLKQKDDSVIVSWSSVPDQRLGGYFLYVRNNGNLMKKFDCGNVTNFIVTGLKKLETYTFSLSSHDQAQKENESFLSLEKKIILK